MNSNKSANYQKIRENNVQHECNDFAIVLNNPKIQQKYIEIIEHMCYAVDDALKNRRPI